MGQIVCYFHILFEAISDDILSCEALAKAKTMTINFEKVFSKGFKFEKFKKSEIPFNNSHSTVTHIWQLMIA
jgi:hypothetical protein